MPSLPDGTGHPYLAVIATRARRELDRARGTDAETWKLHLRAAYRHAIACPPGSDDLDRALVAVVETGLDWLDDLRRRS